MCCSVAEASAETLREMNPLVRIAALPGGVAEEPDTEFLGGIDVVLLVQAPLHMQLAYDKACTDTNTAFFTACSRGTISYFFENLHVHEWTPMVSRLAAWLSTGFPCICHTLESALDHAWKKLLGGTHIEYSHPQDIMSLLLTMPCAMGRMPRVEPLCKRAWHPSRP